MCNLPVFEGNYDAPTIQLTHRRESSSGSYTSNILDVCHIGIRSKWRRRLHFPTVHSWWQLASLSASRSLEDLFLENGEGLSKISVMHGERTHRMTDKTWCRHCFAPNHYRNCSTVDGKDFSHKSETLLGFSLVGDLYTLRRRIKTKL